MLIRQISALAALLGTAQAVTRALAGTWTSKSKSVFTGPGFFNPLTDSLFEPKHTGVSYSFTTNGFYETAIFAIGANPVSPGCATGVLQWSHGSYTLPADGGIQMVPIPEDGRQLTSQPCEADTANYVRHSTNDTMQSYLIELDAYTGEWKLTLNRKYGAPVQPLYLAFDPPQMLPTSILFPNNKDGKKQKRSWKEQPQPRVGSVPDVLNYAWYTGAGMVAVGGLAVLLS